MHVLLPFHPSQASRSRRDAANPPNGTGRGLASSQPGCLDSSASAAEAQPRRATATEGATHALHGEVLELESIPLGTFIWKRLGEACAAL